MYSGSYKDLITQQHFYFSTGSTTSSYSPQGGFIGSLLDYNGFIRLVQFFDNSMFKMLEDYVPGRTNLSTGITINSPVLERNKISYANPSNTINVLVKGNEISGSKITASYDPYFNKISGNRAAYYNGAISGSEINVYNDYFIPRHYNPYLGFTDLYNWFYTSSYQQVGSNQFIHSDFNVLQNNISGSKTSTNRRTLEISGSMGYIGSGSRNILTTSSLQDSYLSLDSYNLPRYDGVKIYSVAYNTYTSASIGYAGDVSYGKSAVIDLYGRKFGLFTQIVSSSFLPGRNTAALKYLVDESGSLTELNQNPSNIFPSEHWAELQNTFKQGKLSTIALFDNQQYNNQKTTDGVKPIFDSGYSYYPVLYFNSGSNQIPFQYVGKGAAGLLLHYNNNGSFISGSTTLRYSASALTNGTGSIYPIFDIQDVDSSGGAINYYNFRFTGSNNFVNNFPTYSISQYNTNMGFSSNFGINIQFPLPNQTVTYKFDIISQLSGSLLTSSLATQTQTFSSSLGSLSGILTFDVNTAYNTFNIGDQIYFKLVQYNLTSSVLGTNINAFTASLLNTGTGTSYSGLKNSISLAGTSPYAFTGSVGQFLSGSSGVNTLIFNSSLSNFIDYQLVPTGSLSSIYGNTYYTFSPKVGDTLLVYYSPTQYQELNITGVSINANRQLAVTVAPNLVNSLVNTSYTSNTVNKVLLLSKLPDETNINLSFNKPDGQTSYGFIIPDNLSPDVLKNIDTITRQVKQKIFSNQSGITISTV